MQLTLTLVVFGLLSAFYQMGRNDGRAEAAQQEAVRQEVVKTEIQKERLMIQVNCNGDKAKSVNFSEVCRRNDMNLGGNR